MRCATMSSPRWIDLLVAAMPREHEVLWFGIAEVLRVLVKVGYLPPKANDSARLAILLHHEHRWTDLARARALFGHQVPAVRLMRVR
jgi:hypothetical protein